MYRNLSELSIRPSQSHSVTVLTSSCACIALPLLHHVARIVLDALYHLLPCPSAVSPSADAFLSALPDDLTTECELQLQSPTPPPAHALAHRGPIHTASSASLPSFVVACTPALPAPGSARCPGADPVGPPSLCLGQPSRWISAVWTADGRVEAVGCLWGSGRVVWWTSSGAGSYVDL